MEFTEINANTEEELLVQISYLVKEMTTKQKKNSRRIRVENII
jgi:hypothetical protein